MSPMFSKSWIGLCIFVLFNGCDILEPPVYRPLKYAVKFSFVGITDSTKPKEEFQIRYVLNGRENRMTLQPWSPGTFTLATVEAPFDPKTNTLRNAVRPDISTLAVYLGDSLLYDTNLQLRPDKWQDWQFTSNSNRNRASNTFDASFTLNLDYAPLQYTFIVENRDTMRSYRFHYSNTLIQDSVITIPRGFSARIAYRVRFRDFLINMPSSEFPTQAFLKRFMQAQIITPQHTKILDSAQWNLINANRSLGTEWFARHIIYP